MIQTCIILFLSIVVALTYNHFQKVPLPILTKYQPLAVDASGEDLSKYYKEMDTDTLKVLLETDRIVLLDARTPEKYHQAHIPKAVSLPVSEFTQTYDTVAGELKTDKSVVVYCTGHTCTDSSLLAKELYNKGIQEIFLYKGGIEEWESLGNPVESQTNGSPK